MKNNWNLIYKTLKNTSLSTQEIADKFKVNPYTLRLYCKKHNYDLVARNQELRNKELDKQWDEIVFLLDHTDTHIKDICAQFNRTHGIFVKYLQSRGYDLKPRTYRLRQIAAQKAVNSRYNNTNEGRKLDTQLVEDQHKECLSKDGRSLLAHRLPLNQLALAYA